MSTIKINSVLNQIHSEENLINKHSNLKRLFKHYDLQEEKNKRELELLIDNYNFCYSEEEFVSFCDFNYENKNLIESLGYKETTDEKYINEEYNSIYKIEKINNAQNNIKKENINYFNGAENLELSYLFEDNVLIFYYGNDLVFEYEYEQELKIKNVIYQNEKLYLYINYKDKDWMILTSLSHAFGKINELTLFEEIECFYKINLKYEFDFLIEIQNNYFVFLNKINKQFFKITLGKDYYFESNNKIYFKDKDINLLNKIKEDTIQLEFLFLYDLIHLFGLSDFVDDFHNKKISSRLIKNKNDLFKLRIDNTKNGLINYSKLLNKEIDFKESENFELEGNFYFNGFKTNAEYQILIDFEKKDNLINVKLDLIENNICIKHLKLTSYKNYFYFCNIKFQLKKEIDKIKENLIFIIEKDLVKESEKLFIFNKDFYNNKDSYEQEIYNNRIIGT
ncbi:MAG: hypothetical protein ACRCW9_03230, partial [Cetobacterium sp.]